MNRADRRKAVKTNKDRIAEYNEAGLKLMSPGGDVRQAQRMFRQVLALDPGDAQANLRLGVMEMWARNYPKAQELFVRAMNRDEKDPLVLNNLGLCRHEQGAVSEALSLYEQALEFDPENPEARINFARGLMHVKDFERAMAEAKKAVELAPDYASAHFILGSIAQTLGDLELARKSLQKTVEQLPSHLEANFRLCRVSYDPAEPEAYLSSSEAAYKANMDDASTALVWSDILISAGRQTEVASVLEPHVGSTIPGVRLSVFNNIANAHADQGDYVKAIDWHKKAIAIDMNDPGVRYFYGRTLFRSGNYSDAQEQLWRGMKGLPFAQDLVGMLMHTQKVLAEDQALAAKTDFENLVQISTVEPTEAWDSAGSLNASLLTALSDLEKQRVHPFDKGRHHADTVWEGLFERTENEAFTALGELLQKKMHDYVAAMPDDGAQYHPMIARKQAAIGPSRSHVEAINNFDDFSYSVDQQGWFRMVYILDAPEACDDEDQKAGWLRFGIPNFKTRDESKPDGEFKPVPGEVIIFPAYYWFGFNALKADKDLTFLSVLVNNSAG